ncbi:chemotaxis response regulator protein-glutamate methylesterase [Acidocella sp.]|uniref:protein-glutamate methylesterase/protein-glutamine glutaminase n=1 Tax=Acidocella sp. TaxID=50710 RepID=UPI0026300BD1|nr:chemotaxis response regulator protein-glutamate methylesterase [Acidocella sp.]
MTVRVVIVDDSATMRAVIASALKAEPGIEVVGQAAEPLEARAMIKALSPDVVTLDIEMPNMNGLEFLEKIMRLRPMPVVMVSTLTQKGADVNLRALELGAFDCVAKPSSFNPDSFASLAATVRAAALGRVRHVPARPAAPPARAAGSYAPDGRVVAIGSSTGGVEALITMLSKFPPNCPPTIISQHMPAAFTKSFAARLDKLCAAQVSEAENGDRLVAGRIYLAPGNAHIEVSGAANPSVRLNEGERVNGHRPSVDVMFQSVAKIFGARAVGVILTGLGRDGAAGLLALREAGAETIGQDEASCVVYGMPRAAFELGAVARQLPLERIAERVLGVTNARLKEHVP